MFAEQRVRAHAGALNASEVAPHASHAGSSSSNSDHSSRQLASVLPTAADFFVPRLPGLPNLANHPTHPLNVYAGLLPSYPGPGNGGGDGDTGKDSKIFFLMAKARRSAGKQRVIFWFNGGPGCSSFDGSLMEVGPFRTVPASQTESGRVELRLVEGGWEEYATIIFVDQPPGTGLSFVPTNGYLQELDQGSKHLIEFMKNFYHVFPELLGQDTYLAGESFAGQYIPYFADAIIKSPPDPSFVLAGLAIGNGWIDPKQQYPGYVDFAYEKKLLTKGTPAAEHMDSVLAECMQEIAKFEGDDNTPINLGGGCDGVMTAVTDPFTQELNGKKTCMNIYDVRLVDDWPACGMNWPLDLSDVYQFLRQEEVLHALHATERSSAWTECDGAVSSHLQLRTSYAAVKFLPSIIEAGVPILMFAGAEDLICNYKGIERMIDHLSWSGETGFGNQTRSEWYFNGTQVGEWASVRNLTYAKIFDSSHMVGFDVPHVTNDMITRFMGVDLSLVPGVLGSTKGKLGGVEKIALGSGAIAGGVPLLKGGSSDVENWYNIGSAVLILIILVSIVALYLYFKRRSTRRRRGQVGLPIARDYDAERVPLGSERLEMDDMDRTDRYEDESGKGRSRGYKGKGKERARDEDEDDSEEQSGTVFALGDDDDR